MVVPILITFFRSGWDVQDFVLCHKLQIGTLDHHIMSVFITYVGCYCIYLCTSLFMLIIYPFFR
jgi:hypothetical protein